MSPVVTTREAVQLGAQREPAPLSARRRATRDRLLDAAVELFGERGVLGASVEEICERAGFTRGAFYSNFDTKDDLCLDVLRRKGTQYLSAMQAAIEVIPEGRALSGGTEQLLRDAVAVFLQAQPKEATELAAMMELRLHALRTPGLRASWLQAHEGISASVAELLDQALQRVGARLTMPTANVVELLGAVYESTVTLSLLHGERGPSGLVDQLATLLDALIVEC